MFTFDLYTRLTSKYRIVKNLHHTERKKLVTCLFSIKKKKRIAIELLFISITSIFECITSTDSSTILILTST